MVQRVQLNMAALCPACQSLMNENPIGVLFRRDENGAYSMCYSCRSCINRANETAASASCFSYVNPNARSATVPEVAAHAPAHAPTHAPAHTSADACAPSVRSPRASSKWMCHKCGREIFATPRAYEGLVEPEGWWWCRPCQALALQKPLGKAIAKHVAKAHVPRPSRKLAAGEKHSQPLDRWLCRR